MRVGRREAKSAHGCALPPFFHVQAAINRSACAVFSDYERPNADDLAQKNRQRDRPLDTYLKQLWRQPGDSDAVFTARSSVVACLNAASYPDQKRPAPKARLCGFNSPASLGRRTERIGSGAGPLGQHISAALLSQQWGLGSGEPIVPQLLCDKQVLSAVASNLSDQSATTSLAACFVVGRQF